MKDRVYADRMARGLSQEEMAELVGVTVNVIRNLEATGNRPHWRNARKFAAFYGETVGELWPPQRRAAA